MADEYMLFSLSKRVYHKKRQFHIHLHLKRDYLGNGWLSLYVVSIADRHGTKVDMERSLHADVIGEVVVNVQQRVLPFPSLGSIMMAQDS